MRIDEVRNLDVPTYDDIYRKLKICFKLYFGDGNDKGLVPMDKVEEHVKSRKNPDPRHNLPENRFVEAPKELYDFLKDTYISRDETYVSGMIGCAETPEKQLDGITNMTLLMYLSNRLAKECDGIINDNDDDYKNMSDIEKYICKKNVKTSYLWKNDAISSVIAEIYVLSKTNDDYKDFFSYGNRIDDEGKPTLVIDLPYIGQTCVHFGWNEQKETRLNDAQQFAKTILEEKVRLGTISREKYEEILAELDKEGILPEYEGKFYEYNVGMPIEYIGENLKKARKLINNKLPENITIDDLEMLKNKGYNDREIYYFCIKIGAPKKVLIKAKEIAKDLEENNIQSINNINNNRSNTQHSTNNKSYNKIGKKSIDSAINDVTSGEYKTAQFNLDKLENKNKNNLDR